MRTIAAIITALIVVYVFNEASKDLYSDVENKMLLPDPVTKQPTLKVPEK